MDNFNTYSLKAEYTQDAHAFLGKLLETKTHFILIGMKTLPVINREKLYIGTGETSIEFKSPCSLEEIREKLRSIIDSHVMLQTLRQVPLIDNDLSRDFNID